MQASPLVSDPRPSPNYYKNLALILSGGFFLLFSAFNAAQSLVGSIPAPPGLAPFSFMALYLTFALVCIPAPKLVVRFGPKLSMILGGLPYAGLILTFLAPAACTGEPDEGKCWAASTLWALKLGTGVLVGAGAPLLWTGQGVYLAQLASHAVSADPLVNARNGGLDPLLGGALTKADLLGASNKRFNGMFFSAFQFSGAAGLSVASVVLALVQSSDAINFLFLGLSACCVAGLAIFILGLPSLSAAGSAAAAGDDTAEPEEHVSLIATLRLCANPRMYLIAPNILYNGASLAFIWYMYNTFGWNNALGTSFVGFGSAAFYLVDSVATYAAAGVAGRLGQMSVMIGATACQLAFYAMLLAHTVAPVQCLASGCAEGTGGSCWKPGGNHSSSSHFPAGCHGGNASAPPCATCVPYNDELGQVCAAGWRQCEWLHGDAATPPTFDVAFLFVGAALFAIGDAVWESQIAAILQTTFGKADKPSAMANLKLWQSAGIGIMFGIAELDDMRLGVLILIGALVLSSGALAWAHYRVANFDTGRAVGGAFGAASSEPGRA
jgi:hypothetical protein